MSTKDSIKNIIDQAMNCAFWLGEAHWQQSESFSHPKANETRRKFDTLLNDTRKALAPFDPSAGWLPIESAPKGKKLILGYHNALGKWRTIMGTYYLPNTLYASDDDDDADEDGYAPEGWYEESESHAFILRTVHEPTHYMNRPAPPEERK